MSQYERETIKEAIEAEVAQHYHAIADESITDWQISITKVKIAQKRLADAQAVEINRWDPPTLRAEIDLQSGFIERATKTKGDPLFNTSTPAQELKKLMAEAEASHNGYKLRAACELLSTFDPTTLTNDRDRMDAAMLKGRAKTSLMLLRNPPEVLACQGEINETLRQLEASRRDLVDIATTMGEKPNPMFPSGGGAFQKALSLVQTKDGMPEFLEPDDWRVTGIKITPDSIPSVGGAL
jgi:hypothetical protein